MTRGECRAWLRSRDVVRVVAAPGGFVGLPRDRDLPGVRLPWDVACAALWHGIVPFRNRA